VVAGVGIGMDIGVAAGVGVSAGGGATVRLNAAATDESPDVTDEAFIVRAGGGGSPWVVAWALALTSLAEMSCASAWESAPCSTRN